MAWYLKTNSICKGWEQLCKKIVTEGMVVPDERGTKTKEIMNVLMEITDPDDDTMSDYTFWKGDHLKKYEEQFCSADNDQNFVYTYGNRLRDYFNNTDQIMDSVQRLRECKESRRAVSITWDQTLDTTAKEVPCLILVDFLVRDHKLYTNATWRSHDIYGAWYANMFGLRALAHLVAENIMEGMQLGSMTVRSISAHIYETDWKNAEEMLK